MIVVGVVFARQIAIGLFDPFMGSGTTAIVSRKLNRNYIGFEINKDYVRLAENRMKKELGIFQ